MTPNQRITVNQLIAQGFKVVQESTDVIRLTKGADTRLVRRCGTQKRANHYFVKAGK